MKQSLDEQLLSTIANFKLGAISFSKIMPNLNNLNTVVKTYDALLGHFLEVVG